MIMKCAVLAQFKGISKIDQQEHSRANSMIVKFAVAAFVFAFAVSSAGAQKRKVAVLDFGYATVRTKVQSYFGTDQDIGKGISDMLIGQLLVGGDYRVIERSSLDKIVKEQDLNKILKQQNLSNTDRVDPTTAAKIGGLLGVDAVIIGDITAFGNDDKSYGAAAGASSWGKALGLGDLGLKKNRAIVEISARMIDVNSAEVLAAVDGRGEAKKSGLGVGGLGATQGGGGAGAFTMASSNFAQSEIGKAIKMAVVQLATNLDSKAGSLPPPSAPAQLPYLGLVADVTPRELVITAGTKNGVKVGDILVISHVDRIIKHPETGKLLRTIESEVGTFLVQSVDADSAMGTFSGTGTPTVGDRVEQRKDR